MGGAAPVIVSAGWCRIAGRLSWGVCRGVRTHVMVTDGSMAPSDRAFPSWWAAARQARLGRTRPAKTGTPSVRLAWGLETPTGQWLGRLAGDSPFRGGSLRARLNARRRARHRAAWFGFGSRPGGRPAPLRLVVTLRHGLRHQSWHGMNSVAPRGPPLSSVLILADRSARTDRSGDAPTDGGGGDTAV